jgi:hypothetical protein
VSPKISPACQAGTKSIGTFPRPLSRPFRAAKMLAAFPPACAALQPGLSHCGLSAQNRAPNLLHNVNFVFALSFFVPASNRHGQWPAIVGGQNVVTNPITGAQQFFRLSQ